jgi:DNA-binding transcriptional LysR family regulator
MTILEKSTFTQDILLFIMVVDHKSFTKAGNAVELSKSVVSKRINRLEKQLKIQLLQRSTRALTMTEAGRLLYERTKILKQDIHSIKDMVSKHQQTPTGTVRIHSPVSFGSIHLAPAIKDFNERYPDIHVDIFLCKHFHDLINQKIDISIRIGHLKDSNLFAKKLMHSKLTVCASPLYLEKRGYPKTPQDLAAHNCLRYIDADLNDHWYFNQNHKITAIKVNGRFCANNAHTIKSAAVSGMGIALLPEYIVTKKIKAGKLIRLLDEYCTSALDIHALYTSREHMAPKVRVLLDFLADYFD